MESKIKKRSFFQNFIDTVFFPVRALTMFEKDKLGLSSLASERFFYVANEARGYCLDVGCGKHNRFIEEFLFGNGKGIDVYKYEGLKDEHIVDDISHFPFTEGSFDSIVLIANINHIPEPMRDIELSEAYRCLKPGGNIIVTMGNPIAEILVHKVVWFYDKYFGTNVDMDNERGMDEEEDYYLLDSEIVSRLKRAGFGEVRKKYFFTQWYLNHLLVAEK